MFILTIKKAELIAHLEERIRAHTQRSKELAGHLVELRKIASKIRKDMHDADRRAQRLFRVKGREYRAIFAFGIAGAEGPAGPQGAPGPQGPSGDPGYMDFSSESDLLGKLESKERQFDHERRTLADRIQKFAFYKAHVPSESYALDVSECSMLEFT